MAAGEHEISPRESEVLGGLGEHLTNAEIGGRLHISVRTVESHVSSLMRKLGASDRRELAVRAAELAARSAEVPSPFHALPSTWTTFVGRDAELAEVTTALTAERLVTLVGPGGIGKTRLAVAAASQAAASFGGGGAFVDLVPVRREFLVEAVAAALCVRERAGEPLTETVHAHLGGRRVLLVLDNCEHVLGAVAAFTRSLLASCPQSVVLATSRERLGVPGERALTLVPLSLARGGAHIHPDAQLLFFERAGGAVAANADPTVIDEVCRRLEGIPLAIELAAARLASLGLDGLLAGLEDRLRVLTRSSSSGDRHGSLRSVLAWSYQLLDDEERTVFARLGVFAGAFDLSAAATVAGSGDVAATSDMLGRLADKNLLMYVGDDGGSRWRMLDTVRLYAREQLKAGGDDAAIRDRHLPWAQDRADHLERCLEEDRSDWQSGFDRVVDDLRAALAATAPQPDGTAFGLALALAHLCYARRFLAEGRDHLNAAVIRAPDEASAVAALRATAHAAFAEMRGEAAFDLLQAASTRAAAACDARTAAITLAEASTIGGRGPALFKTPLTHDELDALVRRAEALAPAHDPEIDAYLALAAAWDGTRGPARPDPGKAAHALILARRHGDPVLVSSALDAVSSARADDGSFKDASLLTAERMALLEQLPRHNPRVGGEVADIFHMATECALSAGNLHAALAAARRAYDDDTREGLPHFAAADLVIPLALLGSFGDALNQAAAMRDGWERAGRPPAGWMGPSFFAAALVHGLRGQEPAYSEWWQLAAQICRHATTNSFALFAGPRIAFHRGTIDLARSLAVADDQPTTGHFDAYARAISVEIAVATGAADADDRLAAAQHLGAENDYVAAQLRRAAGRLHDDHAELEQAVAAWEAIGARFERACTLALLPGGAQEGARELEALGCPLPVA